MDNIKKVKLVALCLTGAIMIVGAGYAAWGTAITDVTTLNTGHWEIAIENDVPGHSLISGDVVYNYENTFEGIIQTEQMGQLDWYGNYDIADPGKLAGAYKSNGTNYIYAIAPYISGDTVSFNFYNMHPGTEAITRFEIRNKGTIPARISDVTVTFNNGNPLSASQKALKDAILVNGTFYRHDGTSNAVTIGNVPAGTRLVNLQRFLCFLKGRVLNPQESITLADSTEIEVQNLHFGLPASALFGNTGMDTKLPVSISFGFVQYNQK